MPLSAKSRPILFTEVEQFGGAERAAVALCRWLTKRAVECHIVAYEDRCGLAAHAGFPLEVVELKPQPGAWPRVSALRRYFAGRPATAPKPTRPLDSRLRRVCVPGWPNSDGGSCS